MSGISHKWDGTVLTITSDSGTSSADLKGEKGDDGARGVAGACPTLTVNGMIGDVKLTAADLGALPTTGGTLSGSLRVNTSSTPGGGVLISEDGEGGTITITSKSGTYNYEIDAVSDNIIRMHNASTHPNSFRSIWWNADTGELWTDALKLTNALGIENGGTGAKNALDALKNLGMVVNGVDIQANDAASWEQQAKAYIVEQLQNNRVTMFDLGWKGKSYGAGIAWKSTGKIHAIIHNNSGTGGVKIWEYYLSGGHWNDIPLSVSSGGTGATTAAGACASIGAMPNTVSYVVEEGKSDGWYYRKWSNGYCELNGCFTRTFTPNIAWGACYYAELPAVSFPFAFVELYSAQANISDANTWAISQHNSLTGTGLLYAMSAVSRGETTAKVYYNIVGRWK